MFDFIKLDVYQKAKHFHLQCLVVMRENKLERLVNVLMSCQGCFLR